MPGAHIRLPKSHNEFRSASLNSSTIVERRTMSGNDAIPDYHPHGDRSCPGQPAAIPQSGTKSPKPTSTAKDFTLPGNSASGCQPKLTGGPRKESRLREGSCAAYRAP